MPPQPDKPQTDTKEATPPAIPDHNPVRCIGKGSYGEVWLAQAITGTWRAVKIVKRDTFTDARPFEREFLGMQRFEPLSRTHPGLVNILHVGRSPDDSHFFYVMEVADDLKTGPDIQPQGYTPKTLSQCSRHGPLPLDQCLSIGLTLCDALAHLHRHDLIHRDIKPSNIIFVNGVPRLADIGLVASAGAEATFVGTEGYIPPEGPGKPSADLYALGKVLYEISMGKDRTDFPELPTAFREMKNAAQLMKFNDLLLKTCAEKPWNRFGSADEMHQALLTLQRELGLDKTTPSSPGSTPPARQRLTLLFNSPTQEPLIQILTQRLQTDGFVVQSMRHREFSLEWGRELEHKIANSDSLILGLSDDALNDERTAYAAEIGCRATTRPDHPLHLFVIRTDLSSQLPTHFEITLHTAQFLDWNGPKDNSHLLDTLTEKSSK